MLVHLDPIQVKFKVCVCVHVCVSSDDYFRMKLQWKSIDADQESRFSDLRERRSLIGTYNSGPSVCLSVSVSLSLCLSVSVSISRTAQLENTGLAS